MRAIVVEAPGSAFSAGHDLAEMVGRDVAVLPAAVRRLHRADGDDPPCAAAGDRQGARDGDRRRLPAGRRLRPRRAAEEARFATPGVKIGLFCSTPMVPLSRAVGRKHALEMLLTGDPIAAATALDWGLDEPRRPGRTARREVGAVDAMALQPAHRRLGKEAFYAQIELDERRAYDLTKTVMAANSLAADAQEGIGASSRSARRGLGAASLMRGLIQ